MHNRLKVLRLAGGRYGYSVTVVGWLRRISGDEWMLYGARAVIRTGPAQAGGLARMAVHGIEKRYRLSPAAEGTEEIHRLIIRRSWPATESAWLKELPKPKDWQE